MHGIRRICRPVLFVAAWLLLATSGCPPVAWHDGLPAWTPDPGRTEASIGYQRMFLPGWSIDIGGDTLRSSASGISYLTPGVRVGLSRSPAAEVGLTSVVFVGGGEATALVGPELGIGCQSPDFSLICRPSFYFLSIVGGSVSVVPWPQLSLLVGNGYEPDRVHAALGGRVSQLAVGPVCVVGKTVPPLDLRLEASYMLPANGALGQTLTLGLTVAAPARSELSEPEPGPAGSDIR
jgi:hypothetical protein